jgi:hypothetical protein
MVKIGRRNATKYAAGMENDAPSVEARTKLRYITSANTNRAMNITPKE